MTVFVISVVALLLVANVTFGFVQTPHAVSIRKSWQTSSSIQLKAHGGPFSLLLADGLDSETLGALGDVAELNDVSLKLEICNNKIHNLFKNYSGTRYGD